MKNVAFLFFWWYSVKADFESNLKMVVLTHQCGEKLFYFGEHCLDDVFRSGERDIHATWRNCLKRKRETIQFFQISQIFIYSNLNCI